MNVCVLSKLSRITCTHDMTSSAELRELCHACTWWRHDMQNFQHYWPFVWGILWPQMDSRHKRPVIRICDVSFVVRLCQVSNCRWFETPVAPMWHHCYAVGSTKHEISHSRHSGQQRRHLVWRIGTRIDQFLARYGIFYYKGLLARYCLVTNVFSKCLEANSSSM